MKLRPHLLFVESAIGDPHNGLPADVFAFVSRVTPLVNVDLLIKDEQGRTLLTWRDDEFYGAGWHVPGGIIRYKESAADRIRTCARVELGSEVSCDAAPLLVSESISVEATRGHFISFLYRCRLLRPPDPDRIAASATPSRGEWRWHTGSPPDLLDAQRHYARFI